MTGFGGVRSGSVASTIGCLLVLVVLALTPGCTTYVFIPDRNADCPQCHGTGQFQCPTCNGQGGSTCTACQGRGRATCFLCTGSGKNPYNTALGCTSCSSTGSQACWTCGGSGKMRCFPCSGAGVQKCGLWLTQEQYNAQYGSMAPPGVQTTTLGAEILKATVDAGEDVAVQLINDPRQQDRALDHALPALTRGFRRGVSLRNQNFQAKLSFILTRRERGFDGLHYHAEGVLEVRARASLAAGARWEQVQADAQLTAEGALIVRVPLDLLVRVKAARVRNENGARPMIAVVALEARAAVQLEQLQVSAAGRARVGVGTSAVVEVARGFGWDGDAVKHLVNRSFRKGFTLFLSIPDQDLADLRVQFVASARRPDGEFYEPTDMKACEQDETRSDDD